MDHPHHNIKIDNCYFKNISYGSKVKHHIKLKGIIYNVINMSYF